MHYIIGTEITVTNTSTGKLRPGMSSRQIRESSSGGSSFPTQRAMFQTGRQYVLNRIYTREQRVIYKFAGGYDEIIELDFDSVAQAEQFIAEVRNEKLPSRDLVQERSD